MDTCDGLPELPTLTPGVQLLDREEGVDAALHALVVDRVLAGDAPAYWIDAGGHARTTTLSRVAPHPRALDRIRVARAFTPYQHAALVRTAADRMRDAPGLLVCPGFDRLYRADELPADRTRETLLGSLAALAGLAREYDVPAVVTRTRGDDLTEPLATAAARTIRCESTRAGPRFVGDGVETLVYPARGDWAQTTLSYWSRVLAARRPDAADAGAGTPVGAGTGTDRRPAGGVDDAVVGREPVTGPGLAGGVGHGPAVRPPEVGARGAD